MAGAASGILWPVGEMVCAITYACGYKVSAPPLQTNESSTAAQPKVISVRMFTWGIRILTYLS
jgi:hypothetical protein